MTIINVMVDDQRLEFSSMPVVASEGVKETYVKFALSSDWSGFGATALFYRDDSPEDVYPSVLDGAGLAEVPYEITAAPGWIRFGLSGSDGTSVHTSEILKYKVVKGIYTSGQSSEPPAPGIYEQMLAIAGQMRNTLNAAVIEQNAIIQGLVSDMTDLRSDMETEQTTFESVVTGQINTLVNNFAGSSRETVLFSGSHQVNSGNEIDLVSSPTVYDYLDIVLNDGLIGTIIGPTQNSHWRVTGETIKSTGASVTTYVVEGVLDGNTLRVTESAAIVDTGTASTRYDLEDGPLADESLRRYCLKVIGRKLTDDAEVLNIRVGANGVTYASAGEAVRTQLVSKANANDLTALETNLHVNLDKFNCYDLLREFATYNSAEKDGVTFTWNDDHTVCNANGSTSTTNCYNVLYSSSNTLPAQLEAGETYIFRVHTTANTKLRLYVYEFHSDSTLNGYYYLTTDTVKTIPSTLIGITLRIQVKSNTSVSNDKISVFITKTKSNAELAASLDELPQKKGILSVNFALNNVTDPGVWLLSSGIDYTNSPLPHGKAGTLEVFTDGKCTVQRITRYDGTCMYYRTSDTHGSFADRGWTELAGGDTYNNTYTTEVYNNSYTVTCSPTITTDTNNFLASTGDTTDRTSAIQAMLNSTGICRLGPGDFYVTGVTIPDFGSLVGSGNATRLILDSSVTTGCAINLGNNCVVRDLGIYGQSTGTYTGQATVGTRHGILWTATADAASPTRKRRCIIENCQFWYFAGGAITCSNVGGNIDSNLLVSNCFIYGCDAGINIAYYSEFHRITNVSVTHCYYGCICNGGNCNFVNCSFSYNMVGVLMDNSAGQSPNNSHGVFSACTVCHSGSDNDGIAIKVLGCGNGEIFTGLQVHFGSIIVDDSKAIRFVGCQFGRSVPMTLTDNTLITFSDCSVSDTSSPTVTHSGNTTIAFDRCYKYDGTVFNPTV